MAKQKPNPYYILGILHKSDSYAQFEKSKGEDYQEYRYQWLQRLIDKNPGGAPLNLNAELTTKCNMACTFCYNSALDPKDVGTLSLSSFREIIHDLARDHEFSAVNLNGLGESLLVDNFADYVEAAKNDGVIDIMFHTNASIMNKKIASKILSAGVDKVIFSVDSPDKQTYESMRLQKSDLKGFPIEQIHKNVNTFKEERDKSPNKAMIRCTMVLTEQTQDQKERFINMWKDVADIITVQDLTWRDNEYYEWSNGETSPDGENLESLREKLIEQNVTWSCPYLYQSLFVHQDGTFAPCSNPYARKELVMGHCSTSTPREVWNNQKYQDLRSIHDRGEWFKHPTCTKCEIAIIEAAKTCKSLKPASFAEVPSINE